MGSFTKGAGSTKDYRIDFTPFLKPAEKVISATYAASGVGLTIGTGPYASTLAADGKSGVVWLAAGNPGVTYEVTCRFTTDNVPPRIDERTFEITIEGTASPGPGGEVGDILSFDGNVYVPRHFWTILDYDRTGVVAADAAIASAMALGAGRCLFIPPGLCRITSPISMVHASQAMVGSGRYNGTTIWVDSPLAMDAITVSAQHQRIEDIRILGNRVYTSGFAIRAQAAYNPQISRISIHHMGNAILFASSVVGTFRDIEMAFLNGSAGIQMIGGGPSAYSHALSIQGHTFGYADYPLGGPVGFVTNWAPATGYVAGKVVGNNSLYFQCITPGISAGAGGPSAIPPGDPETARATLINDGTVQWKYVGGQLSWIVQSEYTATLSVTGQARLLQGVRGLWMVNGTGVPANDPQFCFVDNVECDHNISSGIFIQQGAGARLTNPWVSSVGGIAGGDAGIVVSSAVTGPTDILGGRVFGVGRHGVQMDGSNFTIADLRVANWGVLAANTYDGISVAANQTDWSISDCFVGQELAGHQGRDGIRINVGCDRYICSPNRGKNNLGLTMNDLALGATRYTAGNI